MNAILATCWDQFRTKITPPWKPFFSEENQKKIFHNFNTATDGGLKNQIFEEKN
jgi:hypothetical protein